MKKLFLFSLLLILGLFPALARSEEEPSKEPAPTPVHSSRSPVKGMASGVKQVAYEGPKDFAKETVAVPKKPTITNVVESVNKGTKKLLDHTIKGAYKVATLGMSDLDSYEVEEPKKGSDEPTKFKISIPGT